jgi:cbb3-type cytochrome oxidase cytochrome c subunit
MRSTKLVAALAVCAAALLAVGVTSNASGQKKKPAKAAASGAPSAADIAKGRKIYEANGCKACHVVGEDKGGKTGPDLTHVAKTRKPDWMSAQIRNPKKFDPKSAMPAYPADKIADAQLKTLVAYMSSLK